MNDTPTNRQEFERVRVCRFGSDFRFYRSPEVDSTFSEITRDDGDQTRTDFPATLQVGLTAESIPGNRLLGEINYIKAWRPQTNDCREPVPVAP